MPTHAYSPLIMIIPSMLFSLAGAAALDYVTYSDPSPVVDIQNYSDTATNARNYSAGAVDAFRRPDLLVIPPQAQGFTTGSCGSSKLIRKRKDGVKGHQVDIRKRQDSPSPTASENLDARPTPQPTGDPSPSTTVHIAGGMDFALLLPQANGELISDAETDGVAYCTPGAEGCANYLPSGFITGAAVSQADDGSWIQVTGCFDSSKFHFAPNDDGGQFDVRFPNGAQCTFGGYGASFIEQVEPSANRFCLRCCSSANDQTNCNSHQDRAGCPEAIPGTYDFPTASCS
ncbi:hypothetical protein BV22DRAFT_1097634 [Leucogyrophana mollusca]|uniref:Uncharacterized protein n=1 Tax=Leucogyrophana mollusca TaxID=85980 RepID=A0ACB8B5G8_9AGAM|nr:hypothetical protein BV22DRAFT_1097634 [Leucogyrophana mollusca]